MSNSSGTTLGRSGRVLAMKRSTSTAQAIGAVRYERTDERTTHRNGRRARLLSTKAGDVELRVPKFRAGSFYPSLLELRRRIDQALRAVVMERQRSGSIA